MFETVLILVGVAAGVVVVPAALVGVVGAFADAIEAASERRFAYQSLVGCRRRNPGYRDSERHPAGRTRRAWNRFRANPIRFVIGAGAYEALGLMSRDIGLS